MSILYLKSQDHGTGLLRDRAMLLKLLLGRPTKLTSLVDADVIAMNIVVCRGS